MSVCRTTLNDLGRHLNSAYNFIACFLREALEAFRLLAISICEGPFSYLISLLLPRNDRRC